MSFIDKLSSLIPFGKKEEEKEYYFALNISLEKLTASLWSMEGKELKILDTASEDYSGEDEILKVADKLLDAVLGVREIDPQKILFGVPDLWLSDENLKDNYLKLLRGVVKELELTPMAYVATSHAIVHFLEKQEGIPPTAILVGFESKHLSVTVVRAGKLDGVKVLIRGEKSGVDIEKALLGFSDVETLPSKILLYGGPDLEKTKVQLLDFSWMSKLSFLHFPKIELLEEDLEIKSICFAGGSEINENVFYRSTTEPLKVTKSLDEGERLDEEAQEKTEEVETKEADLGFVVGDVSQKLSEDLKEVSLEETPEVETEENESFEDLTEVAVEEPPTQMQVKDEGENKGLAFLSVVASLKKFIPKGKKINIPLVFVILFVAGVLGGYLFLVKADVKVYVEPKILEKDAQVTADPAQKQVDENAKIIPGQVVGIEVSGTGRDTASGKRQIGDPAKGKVIIYNASTQDLSLKAGQTVVTDSGIQFKLDKDVPHIASKSADASASPSQSDPVGVTAINVGADGNIPSQSNLKVGSYPKADVVAKAQGNFSGGTSKEITVVSLEDQQRLLAAVSSDLRKQAAQKLQDKLPTKKILAEALGETIVKKSYSKNVNDQASEFSLNLTENFKGTAFEDNDLKGIVSKLVTTQVPDGYTLDLSDTETQADVSKLDKDGKLIFLARFKAKLIPKLDVEAIKQKIKGKSVQEAINTLKTGDNILDADINISPKLPKFLQRLPIRSKNISVEIGLK